MQVKCIKAHGLAVPGDVVDGVPDGAAVDPEYWEAAAAAAPDETAGVAPVPAEAPPGPTPGAPAAFPLPKETK